MVSKSVRRQTERVNCSGFLMDDPWIPKSQGERWSGLGITSCSALRLRENSPFRVFGSTKCP